MPRTVPYHWSPSPRLYRTTRRLLGPVVQAYFRAEWDGDEHVPRSGGVVLACNHLSNLDPVLLGAACPRHINFLAKLELFRVPLLGSIIPRFGAIPLERSASDPEAMRLAECVIESGQLLALFPEGTRSRDGRLRPFRFGAARLALKYDVPLVPVAIHGTDQAMPAGARVPHRVPVRMRFGPPLDVQPYRYRHTGRPPEPTVLAAATDALQAAVEGLLRSLNDTATAHSLQQSAHGSRPTVDKQ